MSRRARWSTIGLATVAVMALAGCGISAQATPEDINATKVNVDLSEGTAAPAVAGIGGPKVYFLGPDRKSGVEVLREAGRNVTANDANALLAALLEGLTQAERDKGWLTWIPGDTRLVAVPSLQTDGTLVVDLNRAFFGVQSDSQRKAVAQIVYTATGIDGVKGVRILIDGQRTPLPIRDGRLSDQLLDRNDYRDLDPTERPDLPLPSGTAPSTTTTSTTTTTIARSTTTATPDALVPPTSAAVGGTTTVKH